MSIDNYRHYIGIGGVPKHDKAIAYLWEQRLHRLMLVVALLTLPAFYLEITEQSGWFRHLGQALDFVILMAFISELVWMLYLVEQKSLYLLHNWLNLLIIFGAAISLTGVDGEWLPLARLFRLAYVSLMIARLLGTIRNLFTPGAIPYLLGWATILFLLAGAGFYWLEPTVHTYSEGLWLAFTTGATVGYGDIVPTTSATRILSVIIVLFGLGILSVTTASIAAVFIGADEKKLREELHHDIRALHAEVLQLRIELQQCKPKPTDALAQTHTQPVQPPR
ncbi:potassium channel family protein [Sulfuriferula nivalis]|uniref:Ion transporter n=1 Tax=Sulfuriferula nivalis TaxID=2675298 RepID=A0A809SAP8_9PROT|nr:potassium channel family protein [Sulfuriferula nivalis]BBP01772.1 ion transporter [Sulfuriferula nivalis]